MKLGVVVRKYKGKIIGDDSIVIEFQPNSIVDVDVVHKKITQLMKELKNEILKSKGVENDC